MILQYISSLLTLGLGIVGLLVARRVVHPTAHHLAWAIAGSAFALAGVIKVAQNAYGTVALVAGSGSPTWNRYLTWAPTFDHSRTGILATLFLLLLVLLVPHRSWAAIERSGYPWWKWAGVLCAGGFAGAAAGWVQGWGDFLHFRNVTISDTAELLLVLVSLFALLLRERVDRLLWMVLSLYAVNLSLNVLLLSAWMETGRLDGVLSLLPMHVSRIMIGAVMVGLALRRLALAKHGTLVPGLLASLPSRRIFPRGTFEEEKAG